MNAIIVWNLPISGRRQKLVGRKHKYVFILVSILLEGKESRSKINTTEDAYQQYLEQLE